MEVGLGAGVVAKARASQGVRMVVKCTDLLVLRSQILTLQSAAEQVKSLRVLASGWNLTRLTTPLEPRRLCVQYCFSMSHTFTTLSLPPEQVQSRPAHRAIRLGQGLSNAFSMGQGKKIIFILAILVRRRGREGEREDGGGEGEEGEGEGRRKGRERGGRREGRGGKEKGGRREGGEGEGREGEGREGEGREGGEQEERTV